MTKEIVLQKVCRHLMARVYVLSRPSTITLYGTKIHIDPKLMSPAVRWVLYLKAYEKLEAIILKRFLEPHDIVLELGGGIGLMGILACQRLRRHSQVHIYEANPAIIEVMKHNFDLNGVTPHYTNCVLGDSDGKSDFYIHEDFWGSSLLPMEDYKEKIKIPRKSFAKTLKQIKPTFLVIDIEGGESALFKKITAEHMKSVRKICIELHPKVLNASATSALIQKFLGWGFMIDLAYAHSGVFYFYR
jgi:FkbM family methyltransferase